MVQYIDKAAVVAEIDKRKKDWQYGSSVEAKYKKEECDDILSFLDTIEVKEVDFDKEINDYFKGWGDNEIGCFAMMQDGTSVGVDDCIDIAQHFFELGLKYANTENNA